MLLLYHGGTVRLDKVSGLQQARFGKGGRPQLKGKKVYLASRVLPMAFLNSVSLAQHVRRNLVLASSKDCNLAQHELWKDRAFMPGEEAWRVYLDNYDLLEKVKSTEMTDLEGSLAPAALPLRNQYKVWEVPRNVKKSAQRGSRGSHG